MAESLYKNCVRFQEKKPQVPSSDVLKIIDFPEQTENDAVADKSLYRLQRKVKTIVEDWLEHYRIAIGIKSPHIKSMRDLPSMRRHGAKSASGEQRVMIERESTSMPAPSVHRRVQSAVPGRVFIYTASKFFILFPVLTLKILTHLTNYQIRPEFFNL